MFYAYGGGRYLGSFRDFGEAVNTAYDKMGYVTDQDQHLVWDRINRKAIRSLKDRRDRQENCFLIWTVLARTSCGTAGL